MLLVLFVANIKVNESCVSDKHCTGTTFARNCSGGLCSCQDGFILLNDACHQGKYIDR